MKVCHWSMWNNSGMNNVAKSMAEAERKLGLDSHLVNIHESNPESWDQWADADVHVTHTHFPTEMRKRLTKPLKLVWVSHGVPEHVFKSSVEEGSHGGYGHGDPWMLFQYWLQHADARVTFWPRHKAILETMVDNGTKIHLVPMGVELDFWKEGGSDGKWSGNPSVFTAENCHEIKWPLDLFILWPWIYREIPDACLHACYLPNDQHRWFLTLANRNGAHFGAHISPLAFHGTALRNCLKSCDFFLGMVAKGDFNRLCLEANASNSCRTISYAGNPYSDFHLPEGDQRIIADELLKILRGEVEPRKDKTPVPDVSEMAQSMKQVYESIL